MAIRRPLYYDNGNLREMSDAQLAQVRSRVAYVYSLFPSVVINIGLTGGTMSGLPLVDTRKTAGSFLTRADRFPTELETPEPGTVTVSYSRISSANNGTTFPTIDTNNRVFPLYSNNGNFQAMSTQDMYDTFIFPAIDNLTSSATTSDQAGTYRIHTATTLAGHTLVSSTPVFVDTRANTSLYSAASIPEALDQPQTIANYYLFQINGVDNEYSQPLYLRSDNNIQTYTKSSFDNILQSMVRYVTRTITGYRIGYNINGVGNNRGTGMTNTILNGPGTDNTTRFVSVNDYRRQEFPNGTAVTANTYYLRISQS